MRNAMLQDGDVAVLSRQAVNLLAEDVEIRIDPVLGADPYRWGEQAWIVRPLLDRERSPRIRVESRWTPVQALAYLISQLADFVAQTGFYWGVPYPVCPGHEHSAEIAAPSPGAAEIELRCPQTGQVVGRVRPEL